MPDGTDDKPSGAQAAPVTAPGAWPFAEGELPAGFPLDGPFRWETLSGDGSDRRFLRIRTRGASHILVVSPRKRPPGEPDECDSYVWIGEHLAERGVPVPAFAWSDPMGGFFLLEDLGDVHLQEVVLRPRSDVPGIYRRVLALLAHLHREAPAGFHRGFCFDTPVYDAAFAYERELEYFRKAFLNGFLGLDVAEEDLRADFERLAEEAEGGNASRGFVIHRDFQSRNIMVHGGRLQLIDFQGMRFGPPLYDLASVLIDPYVNLAPSIQERLVELYWTGTKGFLGMSKQEFLASYSALRLCRNMQALGAYGFLGVVKGKTGFLRYIPVACAGLCRWIEGPCRGRYPRLERLVPRLKLVAKGRARPVRKSFA